MSKGKVKGTPEADDIVAFVGAVLKAWKEAKVDGKIDLADAGQLVSLVPKFIAAVKDGKASLGELLDADMEEGKAFIGKIAELAGPGSEKYVSVAGDVIQIVMLGINIKNTLTAKPEVVAG